CIFVKLYSKWDCCWPELLSDEDLEVVRNAGIVLLQREIPDLVNIQVAKVSPSFVRGTYGSFIQIATCLGLMGALFIEIPVKEIEGWWRVCFWVSVVPAAMLAIGMEFCAESPH
ncbi:hypothetical protein GIB67_025923, partial [Kingdonia uniflora]